MPNLELTKDTFTITSTITRYGYTDFGVKNIFKWIQPPKPLEPNRYCAIRQSKRDITPNTKLHYTMSPLSITRNNPIPDIHHNIVDSMKATIERANDAQYKRKLQDDWKMENKVQITYQYSPKDGILLYCELEMEIKKIPLHDSNSNSAIEAIVIKFKIFDEDGICSKELIFVSYKKNEHSVHDDKQSNPSLPGTVEDSPDNVSPVVVSPVDVVPDTYSKDGIAVTLKMLEDASHMLFTDMFIELTNSLYHVPKDKVILFLTSEDGTLLQRTSVINSTDESNDVRILNSLDKYLGICTIVLTTSDGQYIWSVAEATNTQKTAFKEVNKYITNPQWVETNGQKEFQLYNGKTGPAEIKVTVKVLTVNKTNDKTNDLKSAEYQAELSPPYLLFADRGSADEYIKQKMGVIMTTTQAQGGSSAVPPPPSASNALPPGWNKYLDPNGTPFYFNTLTEKSQWDGPT